MNLANEGLEARKKEEEVATRKRKVEDDASWEGDLISPPSESVPLTCKRLQPDERNGWAAGGISQIRRQAKRRSKRSPFLGRASNGSSF